MLGTIGILWQCLYFLKPAAYVQGWFLDQPDCNQQHNDAADKAHVAFARFLGLPGGGAPEELDAGAVGSSSSDSESSSSSSSSADVCRPNALSWFLNEITANKS